VRLFSVFLPGWNALLGGIRFDGMLCSPQVHLQECLPEVPVALINYESLQSKLPLVENHWFMNVDRQTAGFS